MNSKVLKHFVSAPGASCGFGVKNGSTGSYIGRVVNILDGTITDAEIVVKEGILADSAVPVKVHSKRSSDNEIAGFSA